MDVRVRHPADNATTDVRGRSEVLRHVLHLLDSLGGVIPPRPAQGLAPDPGHLPRVRTERLPGRDRHPRQEGVDLHEQDAAEGRSDHRASSDLRENEQRSRQEILFQPRGSASLQARDHLIERHYG